jgi:putative ABC transport system permease protein
MIPIAYNIRSLKERRRTTIASAGGIALVVFVLSASMMLSEGVRKAMGAAGREDVAIFLRKGSESELGSSISSEHLGLALASAGVKRDPEGKPLGVGEIVAVVALQKVGADLGQISNVQIRGVPENVYAFRPEVRIVEGRAAKPGTDEVVIGRRIRGRFAGVDLNQEFELKKNRPAKVVGVFEADGSSYESEVWVDVETLKTAFGREGMVCSIRAQLESRDRFDTLKETIESDKRLGLIVQSEPAFLERQSEGTAIFMSALGGTIAVFFSFGAILGAMVTMFAAVAQRRREVGVLRALGFKRGAILFSFLVESLILALVGGLIGCVASLAMSAVEFSTMNFDTWSEIVFKFTPTPEILLTALFFAVLMGVAGGFLPALQAARVSPVEAMRN